MLNINQNFDLKAPVFNFDRDYFNSLEELEAYDTSNVPDHFVTNVAGTLYQFTDGKWRMMINTESQTDTTHYVNLGCNNASITITDGVPDALSLMNENDCAASLCPGLLNLQNGRRNITLDADYDGINVSGDNNTNTTITDNQITCGDDSYKVYVHGDEGRIRTTDKVGRCTYFGSFGVSGQNEANNKSFSLELPGEDDINEDPSLSLQNSDSIAKLCSYKLSFIAGNDEFKTNIGADMTKISDNDGNLVLYPTEMAFTDNARHNHIYIHSKNINNGTDNFIKIGSDEKFEISRPGDNTEGATITGVKSLTAFANPSATKVWATDGSTVDLSTKANASDVLLKKSASGGYYIESNSNELGYGAFAASSQCTASGIFAYAEGGATASGVGSHAEGNLTSASGDYSHAEGFATYSYREASHSEGTNTKAQGNYAHAEGNHTEAAGFAEHAQGTYNVVNKNAIHSVGIGNSKTRKNAEYIYAKNKESGYNLTDDPKNGYKYLIGVGGYDGISTDNTTYKSVQEVIRDLTSRIEQLETKVRALEAANAPA